MRPRLFPFIVIASLGVVAGLLIYQYVHPHTRAPLSRAVIVVHPNPPEEGMDWTEESVDPAELDTSFLQR